jgi:histidinol-phosphate aminotransferase
MNSSDFTLRIQPGIMGIAPYQAGESAVAGVDKIIKLSSNEGPLGASPRAIQAMQKAAHTMHRYPDGSAMDLRKTIADKYDIAAEHIVCGNGSDELIGLLCNAFAGSGDEVLYPEHGFLMYSIYAKSVGATPVTAKETNLHTDVDALLAAVTDKTRIVFLANPNNPTGTYIPLSTLQRLRANLRDDILLVLDAAYAEFVQKNDYDAGFSLVSQSIGNGDNVVMTRTFSKAYGLGGLRLGWCYAPPAVVDVLNRVRSPFNVTAMALAAGKAALEDQDFTDLVVQHTETWRNWLAEQLQAIGIKTTPSVTNFILAEFPPTGATTVQAADAFLKRQGIIARLVAGYGLPNHLRISIGTADENQAVVAALTEFMSLA